MSKEKLIKQLNELKAKEKYWLNKIKLAKKELNKINILLAKNSH